VRRKIRPPARIAMTARPPTTPPAMAPTGVDFLGVGVELCVFVLVGLDEAPVVRSVDPPVWLAGVPAAVAAPKTIGRY
jgi:hypothetical protein